MSNFKVTLKKSLPAGLVALIQRYRYSGSMKHVGDDATPEFPAIRAILQSGDTAVDIGANLGLFTRYMSACVGTSGKVFSFEPVPETFKILAFMVKRLGLSNVVLNNSALSDKQADLVMEVPLFSSGEENHYEAHIIQGAASTTSRTVQIQATTLDAICGDTAGRIGFIKCDVEGHELECLNGSLRVMQATHPTWMIEIWGDPDDATARAYATFAFMERQGYRSYLLDGGKLKLRVKGEKSSSYNYFFMVDSVWNSLPDRIVSRS